MKKIINKSIIIIGIFCSLIILLTFVPAKMPFVDETYSINFINDTNEKITFIALVPTGLEYENVNFLKTPWFLGVFTMLDSDGSVRRGYDCWDDIYVLAKTDDGTYLKGPISYKDKEVVFTEDDQWITSPIKINFYNIIFPILSFFVLSFFVLFSAGLSKAKFAKYILVTIGLAGCVCALGHLVVALYLLVWL